jgi:hypothetical protein
MLPSTVDILPSTLDILEWRPAPYTSSLQRFVECCHPVPASYRASVPQSHRKQRLKANVLQLFPREQILQSTDVPLLRAKGI